MISREQTEKLKGFAIILVMAGHLITAKKLSLPLQMNSFATFSVSIFLIISGYGLTKSFLKSGIDYFLRKRLLNVVIPFVIANVIIFLLWGYKYASISELIRTITFNQFDLKLDGTMWFVYFIMSWYLIFWIVFSIKTNIHTKALLISLIAIIIYLYSNNIPYKIIGSQFTLHSFSFPLGVLLAIYYKGNNYMNKLISVILLVSFSISFYLLLDKYTGVRLQVSSLLFGVSIFFIASTINFKLSILTLAGVYSYEAYLFEGALLWKTKANPEVLTLIMFFSTTFAFSYILKRITNTINPVINKFLLGKK